MSSPPTSTGRGDSDVPLERPVDLEGVKVTYFPSRDPAAPLLVAADAARAVGPDRRLRSGPCPRHLSLADLDGSPRCAGARRALRRLAARHARAGADPPQESLGEGGLDRADRAAEPRARRGHPHDVGDRGASSRELRLVAAARSPPSRTASTTRRRPRDRRCRRISSAAIAGAPPMLAFGRISWEKGLDRLIAALPLRPDARLVIAGDDGGHAATLAEQARAVRCRRARDDHRAACRGRRQGGAVCCGARSLP